MTKSAAKSRELRPDERSYIEDAIAKAQILYDGVEVAHRSCGIALAETFDLPSNPYQALRRGGITGAGTCGAVRAGELLLGQLLGDADPTGAVTPELREAMLWYQEQVPLRISRGSSPDFICNNLTRPLGEFSGPKRHAFCTNIAAVVAGMTAEAICRFGNGTPPSIIPIRKDRAQ